jgi:Holliday junction resolvase RusA-like endonuclease
MPSQAATPDPIDLQGGSSAPAEPFALYRETHPELDVVARVLVPGEPKRKERPRQVTRTIRGRRQTFWITPDETLDAEKVIALEFRSQSGPHQPLREDVYGCALLFATAKSRYGKGSRGAKDVDNMIKLVLDGLNGVAWYDDRAVDDLSARVLWQDPSPRTELLVYRLPAAGVVTQRAA